MSFLASQITFFSMIPNWTKSKMLLRSRLLLLLLQLLLLQLLLVMVVVVVLAVPNAAVSTPMPTPTRSEQCDTSSRDYESVFNSDTLQTVCESGKMVLRASYSAIEREAHEKAVKANLEDPTKVATFTVWNKSKFKANIFWDNGQNVPRLMTLQGGEKFVMGTYEGHVFYYVLEGTPAPDTPPTIVGMLVESKKIWFEVNAVKPVLIIQSDGMATFAPTTILPPTPQASEEVSPSPKRGQDRGGGGAGDKAATFDVQITNVNQFEGDPLIKKTAADVYFAITIENASARDIILWEIQKDTRPVYCAEMKPGTSIKDVSRKGVFYGVSQAGESGILRYLSKMEIISQVMHYRFLGEAEDTLVIPETERVFRVSYYEKNLRHWIAPYPVSRLKIHMWDCRFVGQTHVASVDISFAPQTPHARRKGESMYLLEGVSTRPRAFKVRHMVSDEEANFIVKLALTGGEGGNSLIQKDCRSTILSTRDNCTSWVARITQDDSGITERICRRAYEIANATFPSRVNILNKGNRYVDSLTHFEVIEVTGGREYKHHHPWLDSTGIITKTQNQVYSIQNLQMPLAEFIVLIKEVDSKKIALDNDFSAVVSLPSSQSLEGERPGLKLPLRRGDAIMLYHHLSDANYDDLSFYNLFSKPENQAYFAIFRVYPYKP